MSQGSPPSCDRNPQGSDFKYRQGDVEDPKSPHHLLVAWASTGKRVLDAGCAQGYLSRHLSERGCEVDGVELDPTSARAAEAYCRKVLCGSLNDDATWARIEGNYDVVIFGDVLEHLLDSEQALRRSRGLLAPGGRVIVSLPNIANARIRLSLLFGNWEYADSGILDRTHLRFFTLKSAREMFARCGFKVSRWAGAAGGRTPRFLLRLRPQLFAPQFVFELAPVE